MPLVFNILSVFMIFPLYSMGAKFLLLPNSVEQLALGNHSTLSGLSPVNPALFSVGEKQSSLVLNRGVWIGDANLIQIGFNQQSDSKVFHLGAKYSGLTGFEYREEVPQDDPLSYFSSYGLSLNSGISFTKKNNQFGFSLSYIKMGLYTQETSGFLFNTGYAYTLNSGLKIGLSLENLGDIDAFVSQEIKLPQRVISTISKEKKFKNYTNNLYSSVGWYKNSANIEYFLGNKLNWNYLDIFSGLLYSKSMVEPSIGFSLEMNTIIVSYGIRFGSQNLGNPYMISLNLLLP